MLEYINAFFAWTEKTLTFIIIGLIPAYVSEFLLVGSSDLWWLNGHLIILWLAVYMGAVFVFFPIIFIMLVIMSLGFSVQAAFETDAYKREKCARIFSKRSRCTYCYLMMQFKIIKM